MAPAGEDDSRVRSGRLFTHSPVKFGRPMRPIHCGEVSSENSFKANFHEKALFVKADLAAHFGIERNGCVSFALCFHPL
jgi:hypothetical protein